MAFYAFARFADDVADSPHLSSEEKLNGLDDLDAALQGTLSVSKRIDLLPALQLRKALELRGLSTSHARTLLIAFRQDAKAVNTTSWSELLEYCQSSAAPVGRFLLDLHNEPKDVQPASDALCAALQILNHIQDIKDDFKDRKRRYIPICWPNGPQAHTDDLIAPSTSSSLRECLNLTLERTGTLLTLAEQLPLRCHSRRLRAEATAIISLAQSLHAALAAGDPLASRIRPTWKDGLCAAFKALGSLFQSLNQPLLSPDANQVVTRIVDASGSSFRHGMRCLPQSRREAMYTVYAFCRVVDDIADDEGSTQEQRLDALAKWDAILNQIEAGTPPTPTPIPLVSALIAAHERYGLDINECRTLIAGMRMDAKGPVVMPDSETYTLYCRRVAVSVGILCLPIMGANDAQAITFAHELGHALQCVNIIRDVAEDADIGRCYLPKHILEVCDIPQDTPKAIANHCNCGNARALLAKQARQHFKNAHAALTPYNADALRPARLMMIAYMDILNRIEAQGFHCLSKPPKPNRWQKMKLLTQMPKPHNKEAT